MERNRPEGLGTSPAAGSGRLPTQPMQVGMSPEMVTSMLCSVRNDIQLVGTSAAKMEHVVEELGGVITKLLETMTTLAEGQTKTYELLQEIKGVIDDSNFAVAEAVDRLHAQTTDLMKKAESVAIATHMAREVVENDTNVRLATAATAGTPPPVSGT